MQVGCVVISFCERCPALATRCCYSMLEGTNRRAWKVSRFAQLLARLEKKANLAEFTNNLGDCFNTLHIYTSTQKCQTRQVSWCVPLVACWCVVLAAHLLASFLSTVTNGTRIQRCSHSHSDDGFPCLLWPTRAPWHLVLI